MLNMHETQTLGKMLGKSPPKSSYDLRPLLLRRRRATKDRPTGIKPSLRPARVSKKPTLQKPRCEGKPAKLLSTPTSRSDEILFDTTLYPFPGAEDGAGYTFGLELEVIVICPLHELIARLPQSVRQLSAETLQSRLGSNFEKCGCDHLVRESIAETLAKAGYAVNAVRSDVESIQRWAMEREPAIKVETEARQYPNEVVVGVEIKSGAFDYSAASLLEVVEVIKLLRSKYYITFNESCGLHVHIGKMDRLDGSQIQIPLQSLQKLLALHLVFEDQINKLHPWHVLYGHEWPQTISARLRQTHGWDRLQAAEEVMDARSVRALTKMLLAGGDGDHDVTVNIQNCLYAATYHTIEFRQHEAVFDPEPILRRIELRITMMRFVESTPKTYFRDAIQRSRIGDTKDIVEVLKMIKLKSEAVEYYGARLFHHSGPVEQKIFVRAGETGEHHFREPAEVAAESVHGKARVGMFTHFQPSWTLPLPRKIDKGSVCHSPHASIAGTGLVLDKRSGQWSIRYKVVGSRTDSAGAIWADEQSALKMGPLMMEELYILRRTRSRRWPGCLPETMEKRYKCPWREKDEVDVSL